MGQFKKGKKMTTITSTLISHIILLLTILAMQLESPAAADNRDIGVCYGMNGNNLPPPADVVALYKKYNIGRIRLFDPNPSVLTALKGSSIEVAVGVRNEDIKSISSNQTSALSWVSANVKPYVPGVNFIFVVVGNEVIPGEISPHVAPAMQNLLSVLRNDKLTSDIRVTTAVSQAAFQQTYPPSASEFQPSARGPMLDILKVLSGQGGAMLMVNLYPYFAYASDPVHVSLAYAQFTATQPVVRDGNLSYLNLFDAMIDGVYWAMEKARFSDVGVSVSETGWPSAGNGELTTPALASTYNKNFVRHILSTAGSPKRPNTYIEAFLFAMFNENLKPSGVEQHMGLFYPNKQPVYSVFSNN